jgi:hypothetical protein
MIRCLFLLFTGAMLLSPAFVKAAEPVPASSTDLYTQQTDSVVPKKRYYMVGTSWTSNTSFFGRNSDIRYPFASLDLSYTSKKGFWASSAIYHTGSMFDGFSASAGWNYKWGDRWDGSTSYSRYVFRSNSALLASVASHLVSSTVSYDWSYVYTSLNVSVLGGRTNDIFFTLSNSRYWEKKNIFSSDDYISIEPRIRVIAGTQYFSTLYSEKVISNPPPASGISKPGKGNQNKNPQPQPEPMPVVTDSKQPGFGIINYDFYIPVAYTHGNYTLELTTTYTVPVRLPATDTSRPQFIWGASFFYIFSSR